MAANGALVHPQVVTAIWLTLVSARADGGGRRGSRHERGLQQAVAAASVAVARATVAGAARVHLPDPDVDVELVAHRDATLLGLRPTTPTTIELAVPVDDAATRTSCSPSWSGS